MNSIYYCLRETATLILFFCILIKGTASDVAGMDSETVLRNTVNDSSIVTSANKYARKLYSQFE